MICSLLVYDLCHFFGRGEEDSSFSSAEADKKGVTLRSCGREAKLFWLAILNKKRNHNSKLSVFACRRPSFILDNTAEVKYISAIPLPLPTLQLFCHRPSTTLLHACCLQWFPSRLVFLRWSCQSKHIYLLLHSLQAPIKCFNEELICCSHRQFPVLHTKFTSEENPYGMNIIVK